MGRQRGRMTVVSGHENNQEMHRRGERGGEAYRVEHFGAAGWKRFAAFVQQRDPERETLTWTAELNGYLNQHGILCTIPVMRPLYKTKLIKYLKSVHHTPTKKSFMIPKKKKTSTQ